MRVYAIPKFILCVLTMNARRVDCCTRPQNYINSGNRSFAPLGPVVQEIIHLHIIKSSRKPQHMECLSQILFRWGM